MFPTPLALVILDKAGLIPDRNAQGHIKDAIIDLQKMSITGQDFETALEAFCHWTDTEPTAKQTESLKAVFDLTPKELVGELAEIVGRITVDNAASNRDKLEASAFIRELVTANTEGGPNKAVSTAHGLIIEVISGERK